MSPAAQQTCRPTLDIYMKSSPQDVLRKPHPNLPTSPKVFLLPNATTIREADETRSASHWQETPRPACFSLMPYRAGIRRTKQRTNKTGRRMCFIRMRRYALPPYGCGHQYAQGYHPCAHASSSGRICFDRSGGRSFPRLLKHYDDQSRGRCSRCTSRPLEGPRPKL